MSVSESREVERKYAVPPTAQVPDLHAVPGVARVRHLAPVTLRAQYFDTADLALLRERITLRKRSGGADEGWHLKLPGSGFRRELHAPFSASDDVPQDLAVRLHAVLRGRPAEPLVRLTTVRTIHELLDEEGAVLAELCDDEVTSAPDIAGPDAARWREWEVELGSGPEDLLDAVEPSLLAAGASTDAGPSKLARALGERTPPARPGPPELGPSPTAAAVARDYLRQESDRLKSRDPGARLHEHDAVHQMRVAARRLRSVLSSYRAIVGRERSRALRGELKALADVLGGARDSEVMLARLDELLDEQPTRGVRGPVRARIDAALHERYDRAHDAAVRFMSSARYYRLLDTLDALVDDWRPAGGDIPADDLAEVFARDWKRLRAAVRLADELDDPDEHQAALHDVRKAAKRVRYGMDSAVGVLGKDAKRIAKSASRITELLGDHNDSLITAQLIGDLADEAFARGEDTFTYGRMQAVEESNAALSRDALADALGELSRRRLAGWKKL
ncbi:CYTH and CHAD domain-containing protein [Cumulibacter manganitolerans]|uniref:CYTH and CHAD domain-containing protein n=1 Tax=Cumulibacter manganitolerans TaxID=1884992 RepID=UPI0018863789|nr:CYTH and CHAD domain-containing protein [Cumulibacter manganitolerans]